MTTVLFSLVSFIVALGILITAHEFGHYWVARRLGVKVLRFSVGFGKPLWIKRRGEDQTEYVISAWPLGGYVKMLDEREGDVAEQERHRAFNRQSLPRRFAIVAAGPVFNFLLAILLYWLLFVIGLPGLKAVVDEVKPGTIAAQSGMMSGDVVLSVDGAPTPTLEALRLTLLDKLLEGEPVSMRVAQPNEPPREITLALEKTTIGNLENGIMEFIGFSPKRPKVPPVIGQVQSGGAAERAGLQAGDRVLTVDGVAVDDWMEWAEYIRQRPDQSINVTINRNGQELHVSLVPARIQTEQGEIGRIGAAPSIPAELPPELRATQQYGPLQAIGVSASKTWDMSMLTLRMLWGMLVGQASLENLSGPISIAQVAGQSAQIGLVPFLSFLAIVSISLGILNLLPVPILDGGHLMYYVVELFKGSPVSEQAQVIGQKIGLMLLLALMFLAFYNDIARLLG